jgi:hypothetical protein
MPTPVRANRRLRGPAQGNHAPASSVAALNLARAGFTPAQWQPAATKEHRCSRIDPSGAVRLQKP